MFVIEHKVERILEERYNKKRKRKEWLVKWDGFSTKEATWEPFENLDGNEKFTNYCKGGAVLMLSTCLRSSLIIFVVVF